MFTDQIMKIINGEVNFNNNIELEPWLDKIQENFSISMASTIFVHWSYTQKPKTTKGFGLFSKQTHQREPFTAATK